MLLLRGGNGVTCLSDINRPLLRRLLDAIDSVELHQAIVDDHMAQVCAELARAGVPVFEGVLLGRRAQPYLAAFHDAAQRAAARFVAGRPAIEWLWYLRRAPHLFDFNRLAGTRPYCAAIAEGLCRQSPTLGTVPATGRYPVGPADAHDLLVLREWVGLLYNVHSAIRWAGKDAPVRFSGSAAPRAEPTVGLRNAVRFYDERRDRAPAGPFARLGLLEAPEELHRTADWSHLPVVLELGRVAPTRIPGNHRLGYSHVEAGYAVGRLDVADFELIFDERLLMSDAAARQVACAAVGLLTLMHPDVVGSPGSPASGASMANILNVGYEVGPLDLFRARCAWLLAGAAELGLPPQFTDRVVSIDRVVETLADAPASIHPPRRPAAILPAANGAAVIDWHAMTRLFLEALERTGSGGAAANVWGAAFEERVQGMIDRSEWCPPPELAQLRRRTLRRSGRKLTDVDAVGCKDGRVLLVSCKSRPLTDAFERGEHAEVRNARSQAEDALASLRRVVTDIQQRPIGDNFDFSGYAEVVGVVAFPFLPFAGARALESEAAPGLPAVASVAELFRFLGARP